MDNYGISGEITDLTTGAVAGTFTGTYIPTPPPKVPNGIPGNWTLAFDDEFTETSLDLTKWAVRSGVKNNATSLASNALMMNPGLALRLASATSGVELITASYLMPVGGCCEAKINFPGPNSGLGPLPGQAVYNWPAWWTGDAANWPAGGEIDIAEGLGSPPTLTCNYHSPSGAHNGPQPGPAGSWANTYHTYGALRGPNSVVWYYDGKAVHTQATDDNGAGHSLLLTVGSGNSPAYGVASLVKVAYVRAWH